MQVEQGEWILSEGEMAAVAAGFGLRAQGLGSLPDELPPGLEAEAAVKAFADLEPAFRALAERFLKALADPKKVIHFHSVVADERVSRCLLAWHPDMGGAWVSLARSGVLRRISLRSEPELRFLVANALAADDALRPDRIAMNLSTPEALTLLAILDQLRRARLVSLLDHREPVALFAPEDVQARLAEADVEDFRWTLPFLGKLLPLSIGDLGVTKDPRPAILALEKAGLVERVGVAADRVVCALTPAGTFLEAGFRNASARTALSITAPVPGGTGHDVLLLVRSVFDLFLLSLSGGDAALSTLLAGDLDEVLKVVFAPPPERPEAASVAAHGAEATVILNGPALVPARLVAETGPLAGQSFPLSDGVILGRQGDNEIVINDPGISRKHARFNREASGEWLVRDLGSSNGTFVNEAKIEGPTALRPGDRVRVSNTTLAFSPPEI